MKRTPIEIEANFNRTKGQIQKYLSKEKYECPPDWMFADLDREFVSVVKEYTQNFDEINSLHVQFNYLWCKAYQYLENDTTKSLAALIQAFSKLRKRNILRKYESETFEKMLSAYQPLMIKIGERSDKIHYGELKDDFIIFLTEYGEDQNIESIKLHEIVAIIIGYFIKGYYEKVLDETATNLSKVKEADKLVSEINFYLEILERRNDKAFFVPSMCYETIYKFRKKQLHWLVRYMFFESNEEKKNTAKQITANIAVQLVDNSEKSLKKAKKYFNSQPQEKKDSEKMKLMLTMKEIDKLTSEYYVEAYSKSDILQAWIIMDRIKSFIVKKAFRENIQLSDGLLKYYGEEWSLLYMFVKICLLKDEARKRSDSLTQEWEKEMFGKIQTALEGLEGLFKYEMEDKKDYSLRIMASTFSGGFSEYFIHDLCEEYFEYCDIDSQTPEEYKELFNDIKSVKSKDEIKIRHRIDEDASAPDIDIHIVGCCAILLKNTKIDSGDIKSIWREIELCKKNKIRKIYFGINFIKNIEQIGHIKNAFSKIEEKNKDEIIQVFDIKDLVTVFIKEIERNGRMRLIPHLDIYRVLDY